MTRIPTRGGVAALPILLLCLAPAAQDPPAPPPEPAWPKLESAKQERVDELWKLLRTSKNDAVRQKAEAELVGMGAGVAPLLIGRLSDFRENANEEVGRVLDAVTTAEHAPLLARHAGDGKAAVRRWVLRRLTGFHLPAMAPVFRAARKDRDPAIAFQAALGMVSAGDLDALDEVFDRCIDEWSDYAAVVAEALRGVRGPEATQRIVARMSDGEKSQVAGLRMLRSVAEKDAAVLVLRFLDAENHNVKKEAINALRVIVDGDEPLEQLSVFQAIEMAKAWKARL